MALPYDGHLFWEKEKAGMIQGACHCGAVRFALLAKPPWLTRCNCTFCRRAGGLWAHDDRARIRLSYDPVKVVRYIWGDKTLAFISCKLCGGTTHWESLEPETRPRMAVNCAMADPRAIADLRVRRFDGAETWQYLD